MGLNKTECALAARRLAVISITLKSITVISLGHVHKLIITAVMCRMDEIGVKGSAKDVRRDLSPESLIVIVDKNNTVSVMC